MNIQRRPNAKWRLARTLRKRRVNQYRLEQRVKQLEGQHEVIKLACEQTHDLMTELERKVEALIIKARQSEPQAGRLVRFGAWLKRVLCSKGNP